MNPRTLRRALLASALSTAALAGGATAADAASISISPSPASAPESGVAKFIVSHGQANGEGPIR